MRKRIRPALQASGSHFAQKNRFNSRPGNKSAVFAHEPKKLVHIKVMRNVSRNFLGISII
jgi:hypothetical protein